MSKELSQFDQLRADITLFISPLTRVVVNDVESGQRVIDALRAVKSYLKRIEETRTGLVKPLNDQVKLVNSYAKDIEGPLLDVERKAKAQLVAFEEIQEMKRQEEHRKEQERMREIQRAADLERDRINSEIFAKQKAERDALANDLGAADLFGADDEVDPIAERKALEEQQAREVVERQIQIDRDAAVRAGEAKARAYDIESTRLKNTKKTWKAELIDLEKVPRNYLIITLNTAACLAAARGGIADIPGVRLYQETQVAIGANTSIKTLTGGNAWDSGGSSV